MWLISTIKITGVHLNKMISKVYPDYNLIIGDYNGYQRVLKIMIMTQTKDIFILIRDYFNGNLLQGGLCFKYNEFTWFLKHSMVKGNPSAVKTSKHCDIYYECDKLSGNFINVYQRTKTRRSILLFSRGEVQLLFEKNNEILNFARDSLNKIFAEETKQSTTKSEDWTEIIDKETDLECEPEFNL